MRDIILQAGAELPPRERVALINGLIASLDEDTPIVDLARLKANSTLIVDQLLSIAKRRAG